MPRSWRMPWTVPVTGENGIDHLTGHTRFVDANTMEVNANYYSADHIVLTIGDVTGKAALTPVAIAAGRRLAKRLSSKQFESKVDYANIPSVVFSLPPIGTVGMTGTVTRECYDEVTVNTSEFIPMRQALSTLGSVTAMKLVCATQKPRVVGIHVIGDNADDMLQGFAVAVKLAANRDDFDITIAIHPGSVAEPVTMKMPLLKETHRTIVGNANEWLEASWRSKGVLYYGSGDD